MNRVILAVAFLAALVGAACTVTTATPAYVTYYGQATYYVTVADTIQDRFGNEYLAQCEGNVLFTGYFSECGSGRNYKGDALLSSDATSADLSCSFEDNFGNILTYDYVQTHGEPALFADGFISETCTNLGPRPLAVQLNAGKPATVAGQLSTKTTTLADFAATHSLKVERKSDITPL